jgi:PKD repeat protein
MKILNRLDKDLRLNIKKRNPIYIALFLTLILLINLSAITVVACHKVGTFESDYSTPKTIFMQGEIVYGREYYNKAQYLKLRIRDPNNNVVYVTDPIFSKEVKCAYILNENAPLGKWNIQVGLLTNISWNWLEGAGDISYFDVIKSTKYSIDIDIIGSGTINKNPNQEKYNSNVDVELTAVSSSGWKFDYWSGDLSGTINTATITMDSDKYVTAKFIKKSTGVGGSSGSKQGINIVEVIEEVQENIPPVADAGDHSEGFVNSEIIFDGSLSYDTDGEIVEWNWDFGDGSIGTGESVSHVYSKSGVFTVLLEVIDDDGATSQSEISLVVINPNKSPSSPVINGPIVVKKGISYTYSVVATDENEDLINYTLYLGYNDISD